MAKLWDKGTATNTSLAKLAERFTVANDHELDNELIPFDVIASIAHAKGLQKIGVLTKDELAKMEACLNEIDTLHKNKQFKIEIRQEDGHTAIEEYLTKKLGDLGKKIHTGRSRNDQVLVALRLYEKVGLSKAIDQTLKLASSFLSFARKYEFMPMPGYTHTQPAMLSSVGMWSGHYAELLISSTQLIGAIREMIDKSPLGSAAGYGVTLDLDREMVSSHMAFESPMTIAMTAQSSRGKWEASIVHGLSSLTAILSQFACDLILYSSKEYGFFYVDEALTTGSSIMPQKKNQDVAELLRARHMQIVSDQTMLQHLTFRMTSGYHRDLQLTKEPLMRAFQNSFKMIEATMALIENMEVNEQNLRAKIYPEIFAADEANKLVQKGMTFRDAYTHIGNNLNHIQKEDLDKKIKERTHLGATGNLGLSILEKKIEMAKIKWLK